MTPSTSTYASDSSSTGSQSSLSGALSSTLKPSKPHSSHLSPRKPAAAAARSSGISLADTCIPPTPPHGLRAQLHQLLPRHALFHVRLQIHQISSVPLVHGEFGVRWKFKHVRTAPGSKSGLLGIVRGRSRSVSRCREDVGKKPRRKGDDDGDSLESGDMSQDTSTTTSADGLHLSVPSVDSSGHGHRHSRSTSRFITPSISSSVSTSSSRTHSTSADFLTPSLLSPVSTAFSITANSVTTSLSSSTPLESYAQARGMTPFIKLKDHNVSWEHTVDVVVKMDIERDTSNLLPNELKLVVMQRVIPGDPDAPHNPRLGALYLNLAQYASAGVVSRKYLLNESKTNAILKLTIQLEHVGGESQYNAPPLPKGEVLNRIAGILDSDVYRTRPKTLDLYGQRDLAMAGGKIGDGAGWGKNGKGKDGEGLPFDLNKLPLAYGPKTTETLIDAIFNPVATSDKKKESPFTYYVPPEEKAKAKAKVVGVGAGGGLARPTTGKQEDVSSVYSTGSSSEETYASAHTRGTSESGTSWASRSTYNLNEKEGGGVKGWWNKFGRPMTPTPAQ